VVRMRRSITSLAAASCLLVAAPPAHASDASFKRALKPFAARLTRDIGYLANFSVPARKVAAQALRRIAAIRRDLAAATRAATVNHASSRSGRKGRALVLAGLHDATAAAGEARACATAVIAGHRAAAKRDCRREQRLVAEAIRALEAGGRLLHLF
jgi:hypothetical protein